MSYSAADLRASLDALQMQAQPPGRYLVAYSGGLDSTVLLHALLAANDQRQTPIIAVHIDHGLHPDALQWREHCQRFAAALGVPLVIEAVQVAHDAGTGLEAAAREARYAALAALQQPADWVLSAHHQDDQAETLLLNLLRGSGPAGLAGIAAVRPFAAGFLARPMLTVAQSELVDYARRHRLDWIEDSANSDQSFDRNYLRHTLMPLLTERWPGAAASLGRSARLAGDAAALIDAVAASDAADASRADQSRRQLRVERVLQLPVIRQRNVLRHVIRQLQLPLPSAAQLEAILRDVVNARGDAIPVVRWPGAEVRRYRGHLYVLPATTEPPPAAQRITANTVPLGGGLGTLRLEEGAASGLDPALLAAGLTLRYRQGGEKIQLVDHGHTKTLKNLLQEAAVVPWMRDRLPLLFAGEQLVAVADLWLAAGAASTPGLAVRWQGRPPLH